MIINTILLRSICISNENLILLLLLMGLNSSTIILNNSYLVIFKYIIIKLFLQIEIIYLIMNENYNNIYFY